MQREDKGVDMVRQTLKEAVHRVKSMTCERRGDLPNMMRFMYVLRKKGIRLDPCAAPEARASSASTPGIDVTNWTWQSHSLLLYLQVWNCKTVHTHKEKYKYHARGTWWLMARRLGHLYRQGKPLESGYNGMILKCGTSPLPLLFEWLYLIEQSVV